MSYVLIDSLVLRIDYNDSELKIIVVLIGAFLFPSGFIITAMALIRVFASDVFVVEESIGTFEKLCAYNTQQTTESSFFIDLD